VGKVWCYNSLVAKLIIRRNSRPYQILKHLAWGSGVLLVSIISPLGGAQLVRAGIKSYLRKKRFERDKFLRDLKKLQERDLADYRELDDGSVEVTITKRGRTQILKYRLDDMCLKRPPHWDGKWRLIVFDVPHSHKQARDALRRKLLDLRFYPLQKSVFITPYPCEKEIDFIASVFGVGRYLLILYATHFEGEEKLKHYFGVR